MNASTGDDCLKIARNTATLREIVLDKLRGAIEQQQLLPGERLVERDLCERLGVSRTSVREALRHLESEGLVEFADARGPRVTLLGPQEVRELFELRGALEGLVAQLFALKARAKDLRGLEKAFQTLEKATEQAALRSALQGFYDVLFAGCSNRYAALQCRQLQARLGYWQADALAVETRRTQFQQHLQRLLAAAGEADGARAHEAASQAVTALASA
jgi:DNA-binding GntR family transcriptional regulator